jgi:hypothetical protein
MTHFCVIKQGINPDQSDGDGVRNADASNAAQIRYNRFFPREGS